MTQGLYGGATFGAATPIGGVGGGLYLDSYGNIYPQSTTVRPALARPPIIRPTSKGC
jgi:hypothetical protein